VLFCLKSYEVYDSYIYGLYLMCRLVDIDMHGDIIRFISTNKK